MQINSLSTLYEIYMFGTQTASMAVKGGIKFPYEWQYIGFYFCLMWNMICKAAYAT